MAYKEAIHKKLGLKAAPTKVSGGYVPTGPDGDGWQRHLLYFVYPIQGNGVWQRNIDQLKQRLHLFNGQRWVAIASPTKRKGHVTDNARHVIERLGVKNANYMVMQHPKHMLGEVIAFKSLWQQLIGFTSPRDVTFYAHAKGVTKPVHPSISVHLWADLMYASNLDHWDDVAKLLETHCTAGAFKKLGWLNGNTRRVKWHYHGTFFWSRNADVFARKWDAVPNRYGGTEMWPGQMFEDSESACIFYGGNDVNGYDVNDMNRAYGCMQLWPWPKRTMRWEHMVDAMKSFIKHGWTGEGM